MAVQKRNDELVDLLSADFVRNQPEGFWHGHRTNVPSGVTFVIPADYQVIIAEEFDIMGDLDVYGELVVI